MRSEFALVVALLLLARALLSNGTRVEIPEPISLNGESRLALGLPITLSTTSQADLELVPGLGAITAERIQSRT